MARISFESFLGLLLLTGLVNGRPLSVKKRDMSKDKAVREMYELLHARRQLDESKQSNSEMAPSSTVQPISIDEHKDLTEGASSHTQLCTDAVTFLSTESSDHEKRNLVINYVYNLCIRPGPNDDVIGQLRDFLQNAEEEGNLVDEDWSNWPGFDLLTTPKPELTTEDYWQQLLDELFDVDIVGDDDSDDATSTLATTTTMNLYSTMESLEALLGDFINMLEEEYGNVTTPQVPTKPSGLENSLDEFLHLLEEEEAHKINEDVFVPTTPRIEPGTTIDFEAAFNDFWNMIEGQESEVDSTTPQLTTVVNSSTTIDFEAAFNDFWNMFDELENEAVTTPSPQVDDNLLPPIDLNKRTMVKKRLLKMLAKSLAEKKAMRK